MKWSELSTLAEQEYRQATKAETMARRYETQKKLHLAEKWRKKADGHHRKHREYKRALLQLWKEATGKRSMNS